MLGVYCQFVLYINIDCDLSCHIKLPFREIVDRKLCVCWLIHCAYFDDRVQPW